MLKSAWFMFALVMLSSLAFADDVSNDPQPIEFPHDIHAGKDGINCMYCHTYARRSAIAGIPPVSKCIGCHDNIESVRETPRIKQLFEYWENKEPIPWLKVYDLPDFVYFSHKRHIQRFVFEDGRPVQQVCGMCHGDVKTMTVAVKVRPLTMGWCLSCHEQFQDGVDIGLPSSVNRWIVPASDEPIVDVPHPQWVVQDAANPQAMSDVELKSAKAEIPKHIRDAKVNAPHDCWQCHK